MWSERAGIWVLRLLVALGIASLAFYFSWWFEDGRLASPVLAATVALALLYHGAQMLGAWTVYLAARHRPRAPRPTQPRSVDVFVTRCNEGYELVRTTLRAAVAMRGEHRTYLLDDGGDPRLEALCKELDVGYLSRRVRTDAKAGNVNAALRRTNGDIVVLFDVDHVPRPEFLERSLGHFDDPRVGFVQVMLSFSNSRESWVARAAVELWRDFYNPTAIGMDGLGSATHFGSNALIRRAALESIGGYQPGLADDLATSMALHAAGWRSAWVAEPLAPGLAPIDVSGWFTQQLKWARGVFEVLLAQFPRAFRRLTWGQRLAYAVRCTYYWIGPLVAVHLIVLVGALFIGRYFVRAEIEEYLLRCVPVAVMFLAIRRFARMVWRHPSVSTGLEWRGLLLAYATWPIYTLAWFMALWRIPLDYHVTPKALTRRARPALLLPQVALVVLLVAGLIHSVFVSGSRQELLISSALAQVFMHSGFLFSIGLWRRQIVDESGAVLASVSER
jgi:cellulose synthase (UDP-forming)